MTGERRRFGRALLLNAFVKGFGQLTDPATRGVVWLSLGFAVTVFVALLGGVGFLLAQLSVFQIGWLDTLVGVLGGIAAFVIAWLLFPALVSTCVGMLLERVADAVERCHYPQLPPVRDVPLGEVIGSTARFLALMVGCNLLILPLLVFAPVVFPFAFYGVNGYLVGREYFEMVAQRRSDASQVRALRAAHRDDIFLAGLIIAFLLTVPLANLVAPIVGTAAMVHLCENWRHRS